jgi:hypothetical protein
MLQFIEAGRLSRFLFNKNRFTREKGIVKANAFIPPTNLMVSVYYTDDINETTIWNIGDKVLQAMREKGCGSLQSPWPSLRASASACR